MAAAGCCANRPMAVAAAARCGCAGCNDCRWPCWRQPWRWGWAALVNRAGAAAADGGGGGGGAQAVLTPARMRQSSAGPLALSYAALIVFASLFPFEGWRAQGIDPL